MQGPDGVDPPTARSGQLGNGRLDDPQQRREFLLRSREVVGGEQPQGDHLDIDVFAPGQEALDVVGAGLVPGLGVGAPLRCPPTVAVEQNPHVPG